jgi:hypothetical protein
MRKIFISVVLVVLIVLGIRVRLSRPPVMARSFPVAVEKELDGFKSERAPNSASYDDLFRYFMEGFEVYRSKQGAITYYEGLPSRHGSRADALEGFSRSAPMWGAWIKSGRSHTIRLLNGGTVDLVGEFRKGLLAGTDPAGDEYWGDVSDLDQRIVEASDIALSVWLFHDTVWDGLSADQKSQVARWLKQSEVHRVSDNNWHLFPVFIGAVLTSLGVSNDRRRVQENYARFKEFYRGDGWFSDGPGQTYDYYNAWAIQYQLYWLQEVDPQWDREFIKETRRQFLATYPYLIGPNGFPVMGRSICYRMAAPVPLIIGEQTDPDEVSAPEARRALDTTWSYFIKRGAVLHGNVSQGYCGSDPRILDNYSGPASCLWALRSLIVAYYKAPNTTFWMASTGYLPVERSSYEIRIPTIQWTIAGDKQSGEIVLRKPGEAVGSQVAMSGYGPLRQLATALLWRPFRPDNSRAKYDLDLYSSAAPFCGCLGMNSK